ncbi:MAG: hypothetical protein WB763_13150 [Terriglobia bacterium]|jgi:hypothetical protein
MTTLSFVPLLWIGLIRRRKLHVYPAPCVVQVQGDRFAEAQTFIQLAHQNEATIGGDA